MTVSMIMQTAAENRARRPRASRYVGRKAREILIAEEQDEWINQQMAGKWSRNAIVEQALNIAMGRVDAATDQQDAVAATLVEMRDEIGELSRQLRTVLAILNFDTMLRYLPPEQKPASYAEHARQVTDTVQRMTKGARNDPAQ